MGLGAAMGEQKTPAMFAIAGALFQVVLCEKLMKLESISSKLGIQTYADAIAVIVTPCEVGTRGGVVV